MFFNDPIQAFAFENNPVFYTGTKIVQLPDGTFKILQGDNVIYEGEMQNGKKHGEGVEYFDRTQGHVQYVGHYENDNRHGYGQRYVLREGQPVIIEDGIFEDGIFKNGKKYLDGQLEYDGEVETIDNLVKMDKEERKKAMKGNQKDNNEYPDDVYYQKYKNKTKQQYLYHGDGMQYPLGKTQPHFIGNFNRGEQDTGIVFFDSSAFTADQLRQLPSYKRSNKPLHEKEQDIQNTENKYRDYLIQMGEKKMNIKKDNDGFQTVEYFLDVDKTLNNKNDQYTLYKKKKNPWEKGKIQYDIGTNIFNKNQYLLSKHIQGTWNVPHKKDIVFQENANENTKSIEISKKMAQDIAKYL